MKVELEKKKKCCKLGVKNSKKPVGQSPCFPKRQADSEVSKVCGASQKGSLN